MSAAPRPAAGRVAWGRRAALAGKLVKPRRRQEGAATPRGSLAQLDAAARGRAHRDGEAPGRALPRALGRHPQGRGHLLHAAAAHAADGAPHARALGVRGSGRRRRACRSPARGAAGAQGVRPGDGLGRFLVAALRVLTDAVVRRCTPTGASRRSTGALVVQCEACPEADRSLPEASTSASRPSCGAPSSSTASTASTSTRLAVELARVALWVETLDRRLPFTFLDHKLRCGDALVGTWLDRFRDYPLLAWWRQSPDEKWRGVTTRGRVGRGAQGAAREGRRRAGGRAHGQAADLARSGLG
jgi:hypothetical protein